jgi:general secretion pathway protein G
MNLPSRTTAPRKAFTLVEMVVVIVILGILAAIAVPKLINTSGVATDNGLKQSLSIVRDAIDYYASQNAGAYPGADGSETTFKDNLKPYLRGSFPKCPVENKVDTVRIESTAGTTPPDSGTGHGWVYNNQDGTFIVNSTATSHDGTTTYDKF